MKLEFMKRENGPERMVAEAEIHFESTDGIMAGTKLVGFSVWASPEGEFYVTIPARAFGAGQDRRYFDYLRVVEPGNGAIQEIKAWITRGFREWSSR